jgi:hypothetical protein
MEGLMMIRQGVAKNIRHDGVLPIEGEATYWHPSEDETARRRPSDSTRQQF